VCVIFLFRIFVYSVVSPHCLEHVTFCVFKYFRIPFPNPQKKKKLVTPRLGVATVSRGGDPRERALVVVVVVVVAVIFASVCGSHDPRDPSFLGFQFFVSSSINNFK